MAGQAEAHFCFDPGREGELRAIDALVRAAAPPLARWFVPGTPASEPGMTMTMIGHAQFEYTVKSSAVPIRWPVHGLALQKNWECEMETWDAIRARRNVRSYTAEPVPEEALTRIAEAGWRAPSASNRQHRDFVVVTDRDQLTELATVWQGARHIADAAAAIALIAPEPADERTRLIDQYDLGQATYAMMLAAADLGIGTGHSSVGDQDKARAILGVPDDHLVCYLIGIGYPADRPLRPIAHPDRRPIDQVVHHGQW